MKGMLNISNITIWAFGLIASIALANSTLTSNQLGKLSDANTTVVQRVSTVEADSERYKEDIKLINTKLDILLVANGVRVPK